MCIYDVTPTACMHEHMQRHRRQQRDRNELEASAESYVRLTYPDRSQRVLRAVRQRPASRASDYIWGDLDDFVSFVSMPPSPLPFHPSPSSLPFHSTQKTKRKRKRQPLPAEAPIQLDALLRM